VGDGHITKIKQIYEDAATDKYTGRKLHRTYRGHVRGIEPIYKAGGSEQVDKGPYLVIDVNWQGQPTARGVYSAAPSWSSVLTGDGYTAFASGTATNRRALVETSFDDLGRPYQRLDYAITASTGAKGNQFKTLF
jgi:hypothetical protein